MKMTSFVGTLFMIGLSIGLATAEYHYYYPSRSYRSLCNKIKRLEDKMTSLQKPVHVHVSGKDDQASLSADGTHVHVHLSLDGQTGVSTPLTSVDEYSYASCHVQPNSNGNSNVTGYVHFRQKPSSTNVEIKIELSGFPSTGQYGFHVHEAADFRNGCNSFGGHYNPYGKTHGGPDDYIRHVGDWGNLQVEDDSVSTTMTDRLASLFGPQSIVGRGVVVHAGTDDLGRGGDAGSLKTGNAGPRLACCAIGWTKDGPW